MTKEQAIEILSTAHGTYKGFKEVKLSENLIENIMNEDCIGEYYHHFGDKTIIRDDSLIPLAQWEMSN